MRSVGFFPMSEADGEVIGIDFSPNLNGSTIVGMPTVEGTNCTATYVSHTPEGIVAVRVTDGTYAGRVEVSIELADGRTPGRQVDLRFL